MEKYTPEVITFLAVILYNIMLVITCGVTFVKLYKASGSWFSALALLMLFATASASFKIG